MAVDSFTERAEAGSGNIRDDSHAAPILQAEANVVVQKLQRDVGELWQLLLPRALGTATPTGIRPGKWAVTQKQAGRLLCPTS